MTSVLANLSVKQLQQAIKLRTKIDHYQAKFDLITGGELPSTVKKRKGMSAAARAKIGAAQKLRWAKQKGAEEMPAKKARKKMSSAVRAKMAAAAKLRWAKAKAAGKNSL
jgi:hypothetical protein